MRSHKKLNDFYNKVQEKSRSYIGYPCATDFDYSELYPFLQYSLNNIGDPSLPSSSDLNSHSFEREVLSFFAQLFKAPANNWWGYITNGGSEGNLYALYLARELYPDGMVYYSEATHYSVQKNISLLNMQSIVIRTDDKGEMDYEDLKETLQWHRHQPAIIFANIGTTMTEAKDDISAIKAILKRYAIKNAYIHCDAALAGTYLALSGASGFDFEHGCDSIAISGHKFIGSPIPCGVILVKKQYRDRIGRSIPYIGTLDTTISGSRNAIAPLFLWYAIEKYGKEGLLKRAEESLANALFLTKALNNMGVPAWRHEDAITVVFPRPAQEICTRWSLATDGDIAHVICMPGVKREMLEGFLEDMKASGSLEAEGPNTEAGRSQLTEDNRPYRTVRSGGDDG